MVRSTVRKAGILVLCHFLVLACAPSAPAPTPTKAAAASSRAAEPIKAATPTKAPAAQPSAVPTAKVEFPSKGRPITFVVPYPPGGAGDLAVRILAPFMEQGLGVPVQIVNKGGAGTQVGLTELAQSRADGYTIGQFTLPTAVSVYLDPERKAVFDRTSFQTIANYTIASIVLTVKADSRYRTAKELVDAVKANPGGLSVADTGLLTATHLATLELGREAAVRFRTVHFDGAGPAYAALLGGHVDASMSAVSSVLSAAKAGEVRILATLDKQRCDLYAEIPTMEEQGHKAYMSVYHGVLMPTGAPAGVVATLSSAVKNVLGRPEATKKMEDIGLPMHYLDSGQLGEVWADQETQVRSLLPLAR